MHIKVPIRFLQVIPLESQSSRPSEHSSWSGGERNKLIQQQPSGIQTVKYRFNSLSEKHERQEWLKRPLCPLTSAHALVISQHIASRTHALVGAKSVHAPESAEQRILRALVYVWEEKRKRNLIDF